MLRSTAVAVALMLARSATSEAQHSNTLAGRIETWDGNPMVNVEVRVTNVGGTQTTRSGEFVLSLPSLFTPGHPITVVVGNGGSWVVASPWGGRTFVPVVGHPLDIRVIAKGDPRLITDSAIVRGLFEEYARRLPLQNVAHSRDEFLLSKARELGFPIARVRAAFDAWAESVQGPYLQGLALLYRGRYADASPHLRQTVTILEGSLGEAYVAYASSQSTQGYYATAESALVKALVLRPEDPVTLNSLGVVFIKVGKYDEAESLLRGALVALEAALGRDHPDVATTLNNLAALLQHREHLTAAESLYRRALRILEAALGSDDWKVGVTLDNLAQVLRAEGRLTEAEPLQWRALGILEAARGPNDPEVAIVLGNLAKTLHFQNRYVKADSLYQRALVIQEARLGGNHPDVAIILNNRAELLRAQTRYTEAELLLRRAVGIFEAAPAQRDPEAVAPLNSLAHVLRAQGRYAEADSFYRRGLAVAEARLGENHAIVATIAESLASLLHELGQHEEATALNERAARIRAATRGFQ